MTPEQQTAFDRLMSDKRELSYSDIAVLRELVNEAAALKRELAQQDRWIFEAKSAPVIFKTRDGLVAYEPNQKILSSRRENLRRAVRIRMRAFTDAPDPQIEAVEIRDYAFKGFAGSPPWRVLVYEEV